MPSPQSVCDSLLEFPLPTTPYQYVFGPAGVYMNEASIAGTILAFTSSLFPKDYLCQWGSSPFNEVDSAYLCDRIQLAYTPYSLFSNASYLFITAVTYRILDISAMTLRHQVTNSKLNKVQKLAANSVIAIVPYLIMSALGYPATELMLESLLRIASYGTPTRIANFIREIDLVSRLKNFSPLDFVLGNGMVMARNLLCTVAQDLYKGVTESNHFNECGGVSYCRYGNAIQLHSHSRHYGPLYYVSQELASAAGKMAVDLTLIAMQKFGIIEDLRDPLRDFHPRTAFLNMVRRAQSQVTEMRRPTPALVRPPVRQAVYADTMNAMPYAPEPVAVRVRPHKPTAAATPVPAAQPIPALPKLNTRLPVKPHGAEDSPLVPLAGERLENLNIWGVVNGGGRERQVFYQRSLQAGNIGNNAAIKYVDGDLYEIRTKLDHRLLGRLVRGEEPVYRALCNVYGYERAMVAVEQIKAKHPEEVAVIVFDREARHQHVRSAAMQR
jgi:hypothetical protein